MEINKAEGYPQIELANDNGNKWEVKPLRFRLTTFGRCVDPLSCSNEGEKIGENIVQCPKIICISTLKWISICNVYMFIRIADSWGMHEHICVTNRTFSVVHFFLIGLQTKNKQKSKIESCSYASTGHMSDMLSRVCFLFFFLPVTTVRSHSPPLSLHRTRFWIRQTEKSVYFIPLICYLCREIFLFVEYDWVVSMHAAIEQTSIIQKWI